MFYTDICNGCTGAVIIPGLERTIYLYSDASNGVEFLV